jgi:metallo-beta-lactamase family protein
MKDVKLKFYGGTGSVTGANFMLETLNNKVLIDCGIEQGGKHRCEDNPNREDFKYDPSTVDYLIVTHAHADHIGRIPKLVKDGFRGKIYSTPTTKEIVEIMFDDALNVIMDEAKKCNMEPMYYKEDVNRALALWETIPYHTEFKLCDDLDLYFNDAGHILGSAIVKFTYIPTGERIVFTGDLGNSPTPLIRNVEIITDADYLIMESVYGDRNHEGKDVRKESCDR